MASFTNTLRNTTIGLFFFFLGSFIALYLGGIAFIITQNPHAITLDSWPLIFLSPYPFEVLIQYAFWIAQNYAIITPNYYNFFIIKYIGSIVVPQIAYCGMVYSKRHYFYGKRPFKDTESLHGEAHWATEEDVAKAHLRSKHGILLGVDSDGYFIADGYQHSLLFAPTGSGKGVGFVIPNLLFWEESLFVHDIKLENYQLTSGWRAKAGQKVYLWNPANPDGITHCYNPIDWLSDKPGQMVDDVQKIGNLIMPKREFWTNEARSLFVGVILYLVVAPDKNPSFGEVVRTMRSDDVSYNLAVALDTLGSVIHPVGYMNIAAFLQKADKERSGVISTMNSSLELWANPLIDTATATSDFNIMNFKKELSTVYVGVTPDNLQRLQPLLQVFYQQATEFLSRTLPSKEEPYGVMFMMDEFPSLGKMEQFMVGIAYFRGYHVRLFLIVQDTEQLKGIYEESGMNSFLSNSTFRITFAANNFQTAQLISQLCGNKTVDSFSSSKPKFLDFNPASRSVNVSKAQRALLLPQEVIALPRDEQILLIESSPPIKSKKIIYYTDSKFKSRLLDPVPIPQQEPYDPTKAVAARDGSAKKPAVEGGGADEGAAADTSWDVAEAATVNESAALIAPTEDQSSSDSSTSSSSGEEEKTTESS